MNDDQLDKLFRDQLADLNVQPSEDVWAGIDAELGIKRQTTPFWKQPWLRYAAATIIVVGIAALLYNNTEDQIQKAAEVQVVKTPATSSDRKIEKSGIADALQLEDNSAAYIVEEKVPQKKESSNSSPLTPTAAEESKKLDLELPEIQVAMVEVAPIDSIKSSALTSHKVVEIDPIQPLIDDPEVEDSMLATVPQNSAPQKGLVAGLLNKISEVVNPDDSKTIHFSNDEEGSLRVDIFNSLVKTRKKHRK
ncbi:hypothetical protein [Sphingobacterium deserti]|uniref:Uncharacterized protein n=1 Tax=Sphingobacterium deserti TaxID=1229276 RepID=A0A0B8T795_9SPHI|nr:hypothetical protein [Sphingobacterium deserti]KGE14264.1 hypothetical protein DI53_2094 [Sphingobacterium deserti]